MEKARSDASDIRVLLKWLADNNQHIDFAGYPEKPKPDMLKPLANFWTEVVDAQPVLTATLSPEDLAQVKTIARGL